MKTRLVLYVVAGCFAMTIVSGCSTTPKKVQQDEITNIKTRVETLESRVEGVEAKQVEVERMTTERTQMSSTDYEAGESNIDVKPRNEKSKERTRDVQSCLKAAGYYTGKVDGVKGKQTRRAIKKFQAENGLTPDGVVGKKTWELLSKNAGSGEAQ